MKKVHRIWWRSLTYCKGLATLLGVIIRDYDFQVGRWLKEVAMTLQLVVL